MPVCDGSKWCYNCINKTRVDNEDYCTVKDRVITSDSEADNCDDYDDD